MKFTEICEEKIIYDLNNKEKIVKYSLCQSVKDKKIYYGIAVNSVCGRENSEEIVQNISTDMEEVKSLIKYLSQNGIDDICIKDVIHDLNFKTNGGK